MDSKAALIKEMLKNSKIIKMKQPKIIENKEYKKGIDKERAKKDETKVITDIKYRNWSVLGLTSKIKTLAKVLTKSNLRLSDFLIFILFSLVPTSIITTVSNNAPEKLNMFIVSLSFILSLIS
ncbi:hypothetical protein [Sediminibacillus albus]|uniref:hypothetical protein n=1 Tax=Sediminibacillus albus TaxID=407036 RepID=UPI0015881B8B|nr:hypothetical protein [Sediminibacillus albus]